MNKKDCRIDAKLVTEFQSGNKQALVVLVKRWHKTFCERAHWVVKDSDMAKDIAQDCWQVIIDKMDGLNDPKTFGFWSMRIVYTKSIDAIKSKNRRSSIRNQLKEEQGKAETNEVTNNQKLKQELLKILNDLPERQQIVIRLFYVQDYSLKEISEILNISIGTVKSRLYHARESLRTIVKNKNYEN